MRMENQATVAEWADATFGPTTPWRAFERMQKEYWELRDKVYAIGANEGDAFSLEDARAECADVLITLYRVAEALGCDLAVEVDRKMEINRKRKWVVDANGHGQHV